MYRYQRHMCTISISGNIHRSPSLSIPPPMSHRHIGSSTKTERESKGSWAELGERQRGRVDGEKRRCILERLVKCRNFSTAFCTARTSSSRVYKFMACIRTICVRTALNKSRLRVRACVSVCAHIRVCLVVPACARVRAFTDHEYV